MGYLRVNYIFGKVLSKWRDLEEVSDEKILEYAEEERYRKFIL